MNEFNGGSAFPSSGPAETMYTVENGVPHRIQVNCYSPGMTLHDWFAGQALAYAAEVCSGENWDRDAAKLAYKIADEMIKARGKPSSSS
jgi:hypothetical protein